MEKFKITGVFRGTRHTFETTAQSKAHAKTRFPARVAQKLGLPVQLIALVAYESKYVEAVQSPKADIKEIQTEFNLV